MSASKQKHAVISSTPVTFLLDDLLLSQSWNIKAHCKLKLKISQ